MLTLPEGNYDNNYGVYKYIYIWWLILLITIIIDNNYDNNCNIDDV